MHMCVPVHACLYLCVLGLVLVPVRANTH